MVLAAALIGTLVLALHYRQEAAILHRQLRSALLRVPPRRAAVAVSTDTVALPAARTLTGEVTVFAVRSTTGQLQIVVTARITGGQPDSHYELSGGDCASDAADHPWAFGTTDSHGSAELGGHVWIVAAAHEYYIILDAPGRDQSAPALHGHFGLTRGLSAVHGGIAPCAP